MSEISRTNYPDRERLVYATPEQLKSDRKTLHRLEREDKIRQHIEGLVKWLGVAMDRQGLRSIIQHGGQLTEDEIDRYLGHGKHTGQA